ncbi:MAG: arylsulfatase [Planctomycetota bacterium]
MTQGPPRDTRTNVLLVVTDDQGYGDSACGGNPWLTTPSLDQFYADAVRLTQFHTDPMCAPSRAALLTGCYSARAGVWSTLTGRYFLNREMPTVAERFRAARYRTGMFGKWHLGDTTGYLPQDRGFDEALYHGGGVIGEMPDHWDNDYFNGSYRRNGVLERHEDIYCTDLWCSEARSFMTHCVRENSPFFCYLPLNAPHSPYDVHARYVEPYLAKGVPDARARFYGMITNIDENFGRIRRHLSSLGVLENTIIVFTGDNGTACGASIDPEGHAVDGYNAGMRGKKCWSTDGGHRNLCMIQWPRGGWKGGREVHQLTAHFDLAPTLTTACDLSQSGAEKSEVDGVDLSGPLAGSDCDEHEKRVLIVHNQQRDNPEKYKDFTVMAQHWRLVQTTEWGPGRRELHRVSDDPGQRNDVSGDHPDVVARLMGEYEVWWDSLKPSFEQDWPIQLRQSPETILMTAHAWHGIDRPPGIYDQNHVRLGVVQNGYWLIDVIDPGVYHFELRRWPREVDQPIQAGLPPRAGISYVSDRPAGVPLQIMAASLSISHDAMDGCVPEPFEFAAPVRPELTYIDFACSLEVGRYRVASCFEDQAGARRGAYFMYVAAGTKSGSGRVE